MIVIGELINGMYKDVSRAIANKEADVIQHLALEQVKAGANVLDVNTGPYSDNPQYDMKWLVESIQKTVNVPLSLDSTKTDAIEGALKIVKGKAIINSTTADNNSMEKIFAMAKRHNSQVIALTMDKSGVPDNKDKRLEFAAVILAKAQEYKINIEDIYLDPVLLPINVAQTQVIEVLETIRNFKLVSNPAPKSVVGLSNISQGTKMRSIVNRTFLSMAISRGLTAAIMDPLDKKLMDTMITSELLLNKNIYCDSFLEAYRKK